VLLALPFSISGAFLGLWLGRQSLNIYSFIGLVLLMGIVKKNSILLVDFSNQWREQGADVHRALMEACPTRLRPILMTSISTIAAAVPPALAIGPGAETRIPMAVAVIGGVTFSTLLTLFVVPAAYSLLSRLEHKRYGPAHPGDGVAGLATIHRPPAVTPSA
jgi:HAE1 family hydrophobic/amphiphilic exporter-1